MDGGREGGMEGGRKSVGITHTNSETESGTDQYSLGCP